MATKWRDNNEDEDGNNEDEGDEDMNEQINLFCHFHIFLMCVLNDYGRLTNFVRIARIVKDKKNTEHQYIIDALAYYTHSASI